jgi:hypothetical protein
MKKLTIKVGSIPETQELRSGDFFLMPENPVPPVIVSDLNRNIKQKTWIREYIANEPSYFEIEPIFDVFYVVAGTTIEMFLLAEDPSLVDANNLGDDSRLQYTWKKNESAIVPINSLENGKGIRGLSIPGEDVNSEISGVYTCEVSNAYGTTISSRVKLEVVEPEKHPMLFRNLLKNGSSIQNWSTDVDIITRAFMAAEPLTRNYGSLPGFSYYDMDAQRVVGSTPEDFRFCQGGHSSLLYSHLSSWYKKDKNLYNLEAESDPDRDLEGWQSWLLRSYPSSIVPNEDFDQWKYAGFFPGIKWIDSYNRNSSKVIGLSNEVENQVLTYITRDKIKFKKDGGKEVSSLNQVIDVSNISSVVDGNITGLPQLNGQFFAYVGAGITGYKIKATTETGETIFNWYVLDPEDFFDRLKKSTDERPKLAEGSVIEIIPLMEDTTQISVIAKNTNDVELSRVDLDGPSITDVFAIKEKAQLPITWYPIFDMFITSNNEIKIFGQTYSNTEALLALMSPNPEIPNKELVGYEYRLKLENFSGGANKRRRFKNVLNGVLISDEAGEIIISSNGEINLTNYIQVKETVGYFGGDYIPITPTSEPGWQYLRVREHYVYIKRQLEDIDDDIRVRLIETPIYTSIRADNEQTRIDQTNVTGLDRNAAFFIKKVPYKQANSYYPIQVNEWTTETKIDEKRTLKALQDYGAAAMFAVGTTFAIPKGTKSIQIVITFTHTSEAIDDIQPELRGWDNPEIYRNDYGSQKSGRRFVEYGYPRCGVSMAKFMLLTQNATLSQDYPSYFLPPPEATVLGLRRKKLYENSNDTSQPGTYSYDFLMPKAVPEFSGIDLYSLNDQLESYERGVRKNEKDLSPALTQEEIEQFSDSVVGVEDASPDRPENIQSNPQIDEGLNDVQIDTTQTP